jgi:hypothetical protein
VIEGVLVHNSFLHRSFLQPWSYMKIALEDIVLTWGFP